MCTVNLVRILMDIFLTYFNHSFAHKIYLDMTWWLAVHIICLFVWFFFHSQNVKCSVYVLNLAPVHVSSKQLCKWIQTSCLHDLIKIIHVPCHNCSCKWLRELSHAAQVLCKSMVWPWSLTEYQGIRMQGFIP